MILVIPKTLITFKTRGKMSLCGWEPCVKCECTFFIDLNVFDSAFGRLWWWCSYTYRTFWRLTMSDNLSILHLLYSGSAFEPIGAKLMNRVALFCTKDIFFIFEVCDWPQMWEPDDTAEEKIPE